MQDQNFELDGHDDESEAEYRDIPHTESGDPGDEDNLYEGGLL